jgi:hypothetical protein
LKATVSRSEVVSLWEAASRSEAAFLSTAGVAFAGGQGEPGTWEPIRAQNRFGQLDVGIRFVKDWSLLCFRLGPQLVGLSFGEDSETL